MSEANFRITYDGEALRDGSMDVRDLAPALIAAADLVREANRVLNGDRTSVRVVVKSDFRRGSFGIDLTVVQSAWDQAKQILLGSDLKAASELLRLVGLGGTSWGVIQIIRWLRGRRPERTTPVNVDTIRIELGQETLDVARDVVLLFNDPRVRDEASKIVQPLARDGIESLSFGEHPDPSNIILKGDVSHFAVAPAVSAVEESVSDSTSEAVMEIVTASFQEDRVWVLSDGTNKFNVRMEDERFLSDVQSRRHTFGKGDALRVRMRSTATRKPTGGIKTTYVATEVIEVLRSPQMLLML